MPSLCVRNTARIYLLLPVTDEGDQQFQARLEEPVRTHYSMRVKVGFPQDTINMSILIDWNRNILN